MKRLRRNLKTSFVTVAVGAMMLATAPVAKADDGPSVEVRTDSVATVNSQTGWVTVKGTVVCEGFSGDATASIGGRLTQITGRAQAKGWGEAWVPCNAPFEIVFASDTSFAFGPGKAHLQLGGSAYWDGIDDECEDDEWWWYGECEVWEYAQAPTVEMTIRLTRG